MVIGQNGQPKMKQHIFVDKSVLKFDEQKNAQRDAKKECKTGRFMINCIDKTQSYQAFGGFAHVQLYHTRQQFEKRYFEIF